MKNQKIIKIIIAIIIYVKFTHQAIQPCDKEVGMIGPQYICKKKEPLSQKWKNSLLFHIENRESNENFVLKASEILDTTREPGKYDIICKDNQNCLTLIKRLKQEHKDNKIYELLEYGKGPLDEYIQKLDYITDQREILEIFSKMVDNVLLMHKQNIFNINIRPNNIILTRSGSPKFINLYEFEMNEELMKCKNMMKFLVPQNIQRCQNSEYFDYNKAQNVWALGITLYIMVNKKPPYDIERAKHKGIIFKMSCEDYLQKMLAFYDKGWLFFRKGTSVGLINIMLKMLKTDPSEQQDLLATRKDIEKALSLKSWDYITDDTYISMSELNFYPRHIQEGVFDENASQRLWNYYMIISIPLIIVGTMISYYCIWKMKGTIAD